MALPSHSYACQVDEPKRTIADPSQPDSVIHAPSGASTRLDRSQARRALVRFLTTEEGGRLGPPETGVSPQLKVGGVLSSCFVEGVDATTFDLGKEYHVVLRPMFPQFVGDAFTILDEVQLYEGSHLVATGRFVD